MLAHIRPASLDGQECVVNEFVPAGLPRIEDLDVVPSFVSLSLEPENKSDYFHDQHLSIAILKPTD
jgi:hypothetical protein